MSYGERQSAISTNFSREEVGRADKIKIIRRPVVEPKPQSAVDGPRIPLPRAVATATPVVKPKPTSVEVALASADAPAEDVVEELLEKAPEFEEEPLDAMIEAEQPAEEAPKAKEAKAQSPKKSKSSKKSK